MFRDGVTISPCLSHAVQQPLEFSDPLIALSERGLRRPDVLLCLLQSSDVLVQLRLQETNDASVHLRSFKQQSYVLQ